MARPDVMTILKRGIRFEAMSAAERREPFAVVRCPNCEGAAAIDVDQYEGRVSIRCAGRLGGPMDGDCDYHETHDLRGRN